MSSRRRSECHACRCAKRSGGWGSGRIKQKQLTEFTRQFATLLDAGLPVVRAMDILHNQLKAGGLKNAIADVKEDVEGGSSLSESLAKHPNVFDKLYVNMIRAGEAGGVLDEILARLADYREKAQRLQQKIIGALVEMPITGGADGLIPAFGVYLASMPADFYNRVCISFVAEMRRVGRGTTAERLLVADAENCGMNTFRGIMSSAEWDGLVAPMLKERDDSLFAVIAISNALGWGNWHITALDPGESMAIESLNGYEAIGVRETIGAAVAPQCYMLTGVAAGVQACCGDNGYEVPAE